MCDQASNLQQQLKLASELEYNLQDTVNWDRKWLVDFNAGKTQGNQNSCQKKALQIPKVA